MKKLLLGFIILDVCISISNHLKLKKMNENLQEVSDGLDTANAKLDKVTAEVVSLHSQIDAITAEQPTAEEWAAVKDKVVKLNSGLQTADDLTADAAS